MKTSDKTEALYAALAKALGQMTNPALDSVNPFYKSRYASLAGVRNVVVPVLAASGIGVMQTLTTEEHGVRCVTRFLHTSGEWTETDGFVVPVARGDAPAAVAAGTYARRVDLAAACCVVGDTDDDGQEAAKHPPTHAAKATAAAAQAFNPDKPWLDMIAAAASPEALEAVGAQMKAAGYRPSAVVAAVGKARRATLTHNAAIDDALGEALSPDEAGAVKGKATSPSQPPAGATNPSLKAMIEQAAPRTAAQCVLIAKEMLPRLGAARWAELVKAQGGEVETKDLGLGLDALRILAADLLDAVRALDPKRAIA